MITLFSPGGRGPGLVVLTTGSVLLVAVAFLLAAVSDMEAGGMRVAIPPPVMSLYMNARTAAVRTRVGVDLVVRRCRGRRPGGWK